VKVASPASLARASITSAAPLVEAVQRRLAGAYVVDPWGLDREVHALAAGAARLRWTVAVSGGAQLPAFGPALVVANQRLVSLSHVAGVLQLGHERGRALRFVGVPDLEPAATCLRRLGGVLERPDEVAGLLRAGEIVVVWCSVLLRGGARVGHVRPELLAPAVDAACPVMPVAIHGSRLGRNLRVDVGPALSRRRRRAGPLEAVELADDAREAVQGLLDEAAPQHWPYR
jgi:hypothetical protein